MSQELSWLGILVVLEEQGCEAREDGNNDLAVSSL